MTLTLEAKRGYDRQRYHSRKARYMLHAYCEQCGSRSNLELHHIDPAEKESHNIWSWRADRLEAELAKCRWLCAECHQEITNMAHRTTEHGTTTMYRNGCRCKPCSLANTLAKAEWRAKKAGTIGGTAAD